MSKEYTEGQAAFNENKGRGSCPYPKGTQQHKDWLDGWDETSTNYNASNIIP